MSLRIPYKDIPSSNLRAKPKYPSPLNDGLSTKSLMEARTPKPLSIPSKFQFSVQDASSPNQYPPSTDRSLDQGSELSKKGSISSKISFVRRDEYPTDLLKELEFKNYSLRKHQVKKVFTNAAGRSLSPSERQLSSVEHGDKQDHSALNSPRKEKKLTIPSKKFLEILFRKDESEIRSKMDVIEIDEKIKVALEKENAQDFIQFQQVRIRRFIEILNNQEELQNLLLSNEYENYKRSLSKILNDFIIYVSKSSEDRLIKMVGDGTSSDELRKISNFMRVFSEYQQIVLKGEESFGKSKPPLEEYMVSNHAFKGFLKAEKKYKVLYDSINDLEKVCVDNMENIKNLKGKIKVLEEENGSMIELMKNTMGNFNEEAMKLVKTSLKKYENLHLDQKQVESNQTIEDFFKENLAALEREKKILLSDIDQSKKTENSLKSTIRKLEKQIKALNRPKCDKEVECNSVDVSLLGKKKLPLSKIILNPMEGTSGAVQSKAWTLSIINLILTDKLQTDLFDELDKRVKMNLQNFTTTWFLKTFSSRSIAEGMLKDFLRSLKEYFQISERFKIFCNLLGLNFSFQEERFDSESKLNRERVKRVYFSSIEGLQIYLNICYYLKSGDKLLPNLLKQGEDFIDVTVAQEKIVLILAENGLKIEKELEQEFRMIVQSDIYYRITDQIFTEQSSKKLQGSEDNYIRFDYLCRFLMEYIFKRKTNSLESIYIALRLNNTTDKDGIMLEDFGRVCRKYIDNLTQRWIQGAYSDFLDEEEQENFVGLAINKIVSWIINDNSYRDRNYMNKILEEYKNIKKDKDKKPIAQKAQANDIGYSLGIFFDTHMMLTFIKETHDMAKNFIQQKEKYSEAVKNLHFVYKKDLDEITNKLEEEQQGKKTVPSGELYTALESLWTTLRNLLIFVVKLQKK